MICRPGLLLCHTLSLLDHYMLERTGASYCAKPLTGMESLPLQTVIVLHRGQGVHATFEKSLRHRAPGCGTGQLPRCS